MRLKYGFLKKIRELTGYNVPYLCDLIATRKRPGAKRALNLEKLTGIHHDLWLYHSSTEIKEAINNRLEV